MKAFARPLPTKLAAAIVAAGVASTGAVVALPDDRVTTPVISAEVEPASFITDALYTFGNVVSGTVGMISTLADVQTSLPFELSTVGLIAVNLEDPMLRDSLFSWAIQRYLNPSDNYPYGSFAWDFKSELEFALDFLPPSLYTAAYNAINEIADAIGETFATALTNPVFGEMATSAFWFDDPLGQTIYAARLAAIAPIYLNYNVVDYFAYLPALLEATFESALRDPSEIPGLISNLIYSAVAPYSLTGYWSLLDGVVYPLVAPIIALPGPFGDITEGILQGVQNVIADVLDLLPTPVEPTPLAFSSLLEIDSASVPEEEPENTEISALQAPADEGEAEESADAVEDNAEDAEGAEGVEDAAALDDEVETDAAVKTTGGFKVKSGNKFAPGATTPADGDTTGGDAQVEAEAPAATDPESSDDGDGDGDGDGAGAGAGSSESES
ncbi:hypothetical protein [Mycolicibacterium phlei]